MRFKMRLDVWYNVSERVRLNHPASYKSAEPVDGGRFIEITDSPGGEVGSTSLIEEMRRNPFTDRLP